MPATDEPALQALERLTAELDRCAADLEHARARAGFLLTQRRSGRAWLDIVAAEERPLVVESVSAVLGRLASAGHEWRRAQAAALQAEDVSINRIAALFGVTRQRISTLLRDPAPEDQAAGQDTGTD